MHGQVTISSEEIENHSLIGRLKSRFFSAQEKTVKISLALSVLGLISGTAVAFGMAGASKKTEAGIAIFAGVVSCLSILIIGCTLDRIKKKRRLATSIETTPFRNNSAQPDYSTFEPHAS